MEQPVSPSLNYPLHFKFKIGTLANDFVATDALGQELFYVREKILTWRDTIKVYRDSSKSTLLYELISNKLIDFQQTFTISDPATGRVVGKVRRKSIRSLWRSTFNLLRADDTHDHTITEKNPWTKMWDGLFGELPLVGVLSGYLFNPAYILRDQSGLELFEIRKEPSFFGRKFSIHKLHAAPTHEERLLLSTMLMVLVERNNG